MFCQCGNTVTQPGNPNEPYSYENMSLNVNPPSSNKTILIAVIAGFLIFAIIVGAIISFIVKSATVMSDRSRWENVSKPSYSITMPPDLKETDDAISVPSELQHLDTFRSFNAIVDISKYTYTADQKKYLKRQAAIDIVKESLKKSGSEPLEHGEFIYVEFAQDSGNVFWGTNQAWTVDAMYITNDGFYEVEIFTPMNKHEKYEEAVFAMLDSFRPKSAS
jgi:hypothetical protein